MGGDPAERGDPGGKSQSTTSTSAGQLLASLPPPMFDIGQFNQGSRNFKGGPGKSDK